MRICDILQIDNTVSWRLWRLRFRSSELERIDGVQGLLLGAQFARSPVLDWCRLHTGVGSMFRDWIEGELCGDINTV